MPVRRQRAISSHDPHCRSGRGGALKGLQLQRLQAFDASGFRLAEVLVSGVDRGFADLVLLGRFGRRGVIRLAQDR